MYIIDHYWLFIYEFAVFYFVIVKVICILYCIIVVLTLVNRDRFSIYALCVHGILCKIIHVFICNISILKIFRRKWYDP